MPRDNQISVDTDRNVFCCIPCGDRHFVSKHSLIQHCRAAEIHEGEWCERCQWLFVSPRARNSHCDRSLRHWECQYCDLDEYDGEALVSHLASQHSHCYDCEVTFNDYRTHRIQSHYRCSLCPNEFNTQNEVMMHQKVHMSKARECYGCTRKFATDSAILIHLESGTCSCGINCDGIDRLAFQCYQSRHYVNEWDDLLRYRCPDCDTGFRYVSGLFQHIETTVCDHGYEGSIAKLRRYLINEVGVWNASDSSY